MHAPERGSLWYALYVRNRFEKVVATDLRGKGCEEFLPLYRPSRRSSRTKAIDLPLFPGYVFCRFNPLESMSILTIPGVKAIVGFRRNFMPVDEGKLNAIRTILKSGNYCEPWPFLQIGERVRVERGPLSGIEGILLTVKNTYHLVISINLLQQSVAVEIDRDCLGRESARDQAAGC